MISERMAKRNRSQAMKKMREDLPPFQELRRRMSVGRPAEVEHTPLSAVNAACVAANSVLAEINKMGLTAIMLDVAVVADAADKKPGGRTFPVPHSVAGIGKVVDAIAALPEVQLVGLIFCVVNTATGDWEIWTKAFRRGREYQKTLDVAVARQVQELAAGDADMTPEVKKFLADSQFPWETCHLVCMDGSFFPPSTDVNVLDAAVRKLGCAGFIGCVYKKSTNELVQMIRPYGIETPEATAALKAAADVLNPNAVVVTETGDAPSAN